MFGFDAHFYGTNIYIGGKKEYTLGEILMKYMSKKFKGLDNIYYQCKRYVGILRYPETKEEARECNEFFQKAIMFYSSLDEMISSLPPYNSMNMKPNKLYNLLNTEPWLWSEEEDEFSDNGDCLDYNDHFTTTLPLEDITETDLIDGVLKFDDELKAFATEYMVFVEDLLRVQNIYHNFLEMLHSQSKYLDNNETANVYLEFMEWTKKNLYPYEKLKPSGTMTISHTVLNKNKSSVLCESYHFSTIGAFLYIELFKGMELHYLPKRCGYCGKYFLLEAGIYSDYCTRPVKDKEGVVCRDVGHRKKYADKVKNDPVWLVYSRAYKAHYARYMKKKMSQSEFQKWADFALEMREMALNDEVEFEVYCERIKE